MESVIPIDRNAHAAELWRKNGPFCTMIAAISNILARARAPLRAATAAIETVVIVSRVVCSDETSVRVKGKTWWEWVFVSTLAVLHVIQPSRGKAVVQALLADTRP